MMITEGIIMEEEATTDQEIAEDLIMALIVISIDREPTLPGATIDLTSKIESIVEPADQAVLPHPQEHQGLLRDTEEPVQDQEAEDSVNNFSINLKRKWIT